MNTPTEDPREDEFDAALRARRRFVPRFDDGNDDAEPSAELDRVVLARARDALRTAPAAAEARTATTPRGTPERHYRGPRWAVPLALVATVLLSFTLLLQLDPARNDTVLAPRADAPAASVLAEQDVGATAMSAPAGSAELARDTAASGEAPAAAPRARALEGAAAASSRAAAPRAAPAPEPLPAPPPAFAPAVSASPPAAPPPPPPSMATEADAAGASAPSGVASDAADRNVALEQESRERTAARREAAPLRDALQRDSLQRAANAPAAKSATSVAGGDGGDETQAWLERIERLRLAGDLDTARAQLAEFRRRHPEIELPPALRDLR